MNKLFMILLLGLASCNFFKGADAAEAGSEEDSKPVARVYDTYLYKKDLKPIFSQARTAKDSANLVQRYIDSWVKKQLLLQEAENKTDLDRTEIEKRVQEYRYQLLVYAYQKQYIEENLDTVVTEEEIKNYYAQNQQNFELKQNIVKALFVKVPLEAPKIDNVKKWIRSDKPGDFDELKSYCYSFGENYSLNDTLWMDFDELTRNTPFAELSNKVQFLQQNRYVEKSGNGFLYLLNIREYKIGDQVSPLTYVRDQIVEMILNKRKVELQEKHEDAILENATKNKEYEIFQ